MMGSPPRSCGKDLLRVLVRLSDPGSPPLVRERRQSYAEQPILGGITPARAGKTSYNFTCGFLHRDHPRSCGKDANEQLTKTKNSGSPPLVRERLCSLRSTTIALRITPARAGKTHQCATAICQRRDHPRSCGKDTALSLSSVR